LKAINCIYDGSWNGLLSVIYEAYEQQFDPRHIFRKGEEKHDLFVPVAEICTDETHAQRVEIGLRNKSKLVYRRLVKAILSEHDDREILIWNVSKLLFLNKYKAESDYRNPHVLRLKQIEKEIGREVHRMHAFVRFQRSVDEIWYAFIEPDFNVLPLIGEHFEKRYADQRWVIYDLKRKFGLHYDLEKTDFITIDFREIIKAGKLPELALHDQEKQYRQLWQHYFKAVDIKERENMPLHLRHVPKRYWPLLTEKEL
jgi:probable DNA metabolism protein